MANEMKVIRGFQSDFEIDLNSALDEGWLNESNSLLVTVDDDENFIYHTIVFREENP